MRYQFKRYKDYYKFKWTKMTNHMKRRGTHLWYYRVAFYKRRKQ